MGMLDSLSEFDLKRFAAGVITDLCLDEQQATLDVVREIVRLFIAKQGGMMTLAIGTQDLYQEIYETAVKVADLPEDKSLALLARYAGVNVRIGGWQTPFITLPLDHMLNYIKRPVEMESK